MIRKLILIFFSSLYVLFASSQAMAVEDTSVRKPIPGQDFAVSYDANYDVAEDGVTQVTEKITLRNLTSQYYASEYKVTIGVTNLSDVNAVDSSGQKLDTVSELKDTYTILTTKFNQQVAGLDKKFTWILNYKSKDFAQKAGKVWEISLPRLQPKAKLDNYNLKLGIPLSFGEPSLMTPAAKSQTTSAGKMILGFDREQLQTNGVSMSFGSNQLYTFNLKYHLENTSIFPLLTNIALPPDTNYQDVLYESIKPEPINVTVDEDGNYLAWYRLSRGQKLSIEVKGAAKLYAKTKVKNSELSDKLKEKYTSQDKYWESRSPEIKDKLKEILKDNMQSSNEVKAKLIHKYVVNLLKYNPSRISDNIERFGAVAALNNPTSAVCMEFTDLFIALARSANVPARELDGYGFTANSKLRPSSLNGDVLHAWPQYWDDLKGWVMIDPTWENTTQGVDYFNTLDLNHLVFVIKGLSSEKPVPAGSYKYQGNPSQDVKVLLSDVDFLDKPQLTANIEMSEEVIAGFPVTMNIRVQNRGNIAQPATLFSVHANKLSILDLKSDKQDVQNLGVIPPFGYAQFQYNLRTKSFFDSYKDVVTVSVNNQTFEKNISVYPFFVFKTFPLVLGLIVSLISGIYVLILGVMVYRRRFKKSKKKVI